MSRTHIDHIGIIVADLDQAIARLGPLFGGAPEIKELADVGLRVAVFHAANLTVELLQYTGKNDAFARRVMAVKGEPIQGLEAAEAQEGVHVFHAGTAEVDGQIVAAGRRVLNVGAAAPDLPTALRTVYDAIAGIEWPSKRFRTDIGRRLLERVEPTDETGAYDVASYRSDSKS